MKKNEKIAGGFALLAIGAAALMIGAFSDKGREEAYTDIFKAESGYEDGGAESEAGETAAADGVDKSAQEVKEQKGQDMIVVDIKGAVKNPREYEMKDGSRVRDIIEKAGGLTEDADEERIYYSKILVDEECVRIYRIGEGEGEEDIGNEGGSGASSVSSDGKININKASAAELEMLPGIGAVKAQSIISYREANGRFSSVDELANVDGIGAKTVEKLRDKAKVK